MNSKTRKLVYISMLVSQAMILSYVESLLPVMPIQGAKLGLANITTILALCTLNFSASFLIVVARVLLNSLMFGSMASLIYSLTGGILSLVVMYLILKLFRKGLSLISVSILGSISHNIGQLIVAILVLDNNMNLLLILPYLLLIAIPTGLFVGLASNYLVKYLQHSNFNFKNDR
ncbi:MAG: Gx transporter family protein [Eubacteriaceae bacterium]